jgi:hypothetical protein
MQSDESMYFVYLRRISLAPRIPALKNCGNRIVSWADSSVSVEGAWMQKTN